MKRNTKQLTLGELIAAAYRMWGEGTAADRVKLALKARLIVFQEPGQFSLGPKRRAV